MCIHVINHIHIPLLVDVFDKSFCNDWMMEYNTGFSVASVGVAKILQSNPLL